ncbi:F0F1 ATP synthase subunit B [Ammoniphilus sp. CFH 90114]|uniref:F0F1 ATP synthase subunit B n=1 Tax=Ammoniphilus sp. CFH 90114 TaxID=2493665 RepID=UPI00100E42C3|nr:F0F1 ATP synthase subunit B [Ammoniphilus sp. CFH 90114]RXT01120.1 ATP synthase F0 subunit B [Ammoniphilus sp. CFH 90114]
MPHIEWGTALYQLFVFLVLFLLLRKYALGPIMGVMESRSQKIANDIAAAEKNREEAMKLLEEQKNELKAARQDAQKVLETARVSAEKQAEDIVAKAKEEAEQFKKSAQTEIAREKEQAMAALREQVGALSVMLATKIIEKELDGQQQEKLVTDFLKEVGEVK